MFKNSTEISTSCFAPTSDNPEIILYDRVVDPVQILALFLRNDSSKDAIVHSAFVGIGKPADNYNPPRDTHGTRGLALPRGYSVN